MWKENEIKNLNYSELGAHISLLLGRKERRDHADYKVNQELLDYLQELQKKYADPEIAAKMVNSIPSNRCRLNKPFLDENVPWFVAFYLENSPEKSCHKVFVHINNCYECAKIFAQVHSNAAPSDSKDGRSNSK